MRRSARTCPPVWQVAQYCRLRSANDTSRTTSPHTGQASPVRPWTRIPRRLASLSSAAGLPDDVSTASVSTSRTVVQVGHVVGLEAAGQAERARPGGVQDLVGVRVADPGDEPLVAEQPLELLVACREQA